MVLVRYILIFLFTLSSFFGTAFAAPSINNTNISDKDLSLRDIEIGNKWANNDVLESFLDASFIREFFFAPGAQSGGQWIMNLFVNIAFGIKNFFITISVIFLIIGVIKLLFSGWDEESVKKWRSNIIWVSVGIIVMQIVFSAWNVLIIKDPTPIGSRFAYQIYTSILVPMISLIQMLASFGFIAMSIYAFYIMVTGSGDEEKMKKWKNTVIYGLIGFALIKLPKEFISAIYGSPDCKDQASGFVLIGDCVIKNQNLVGTIGIFARIVNFLNGFLALICVLLVIYAGWLVFMSWGDEEKLKKAKNIVLYIIIGLILLVASHSIFRFFLMK